MLDPGPRITAIEAGLFEKFDAKKISNAGKMPAGFIDEWGICVNAQVVGIAYNPKKVPAPKGWKDLFSDPWVSRLGLTGFQTTFGTVSLIEIAKVFGGSETNVDPALVELKKVLPKIKKRTPSKRSRRRRNPQSHKTTKHRRACALWWHPVQRALPVASVGPAQSQTATAH